MIDGAMAARGKRRGAGGVQEEGRLAMRGARGGTTICQNTHTHIHTPTCDVVLLEGVAVDLVLVGAVLLQPLAHILLGPQGYWLGQPYVSRLRATTEGEHTHMSTCAVAPVHHT